MASNILLIQKPITWITLNSANKILLVNNSIGMKETSATISKGELSFSRLYLQMDFNQSLHSSSLICRDCSRLTSTSYCLPMYKYVVLASKFTILNWQKPKTSLLHCLIALVVCKSQVYNGFEKVEEERDSPNQAALIIISQERSLLYASKDWKGQRSKIKRLSNESLIGL